MKRLSKLLSPRGTRHKNSTISNIPGNVHNKDFAEGIHHNNPSTPSDIPGHEHEKGHVPAEAQWNEIFQESLRDFQLKFEEEETARSMGERARQDEFNRSMKDFGDISQRNHLRRQESCKETEASQEERFQRADAEREAIFVKRQQFRALAFEAGQEMRKKRAEWYSITRKELLKDGRQRLAEKCDALNAALMDQFDRLMKRREEMTEGEMMQVVEEQSSQDMLVQVPPDGDWRPVDSQSASSLPPSSTSLSQTPFVEGLNFLTQPTSPESSDQQYTQISQTLYPSSRNLQTSSSSHPESLNSLIQPGSTESDEKEDQSSHSIEQGNSRGSTHTDLVEMDTIESSLMRVEEQRQERFLRSESERDRRFRLSEAARDDMERRRNFVFNKRMKHWSKTETFRGREEERFGREFRRSSAFQSFQGECFWVFSMSLSHFKEQAEAKADLEEVWFHHRKDVILALCKSQAIQLDRHITPDQVVWFEYMRGKYCHRPLPNNGTASSGIYSSTNSSSIPPCPFALEDLPKRASHDRFEPRTVLGGGFVQNALPIPKVTDCVKPSMQRMFEQSQELRGGAFQKGAKDRDYTFTINEAKREAEFVKIQQKRQETFDEAEELRESGFEEAQRQYEAEFQANEQKREDDFHKNEVERMDETRRAQEHREQEFQSIMMSLKQRCIDDIGRRLKEVEILGEELMMCRESGLKIMDISRYK